MSTEMVDPTFNPPPELVIQVLSDAATAAGDERTLDKLATAQWQAAALAERRDKTEGHRPGE